MYEFKNIKRWRIAREIDRMNDEYLVSFKGSIEWLTDVQQAAEFDDEDDAEAAAEKHGGWVEDYTVTRRVPVRRATLGPSKFYQAAE